MREEKPWQSSGKFPTRTATVHCSGGCRAKRDENGGLLCAYGCVACGACVEACRFGAVQINDLGCAEVDEEKCIGCGACARKCPRGLIDLRRTEDRIAVLCSNRDKGFDPATKTGPDRVRCQLHRLRPVREEVSRRRHPCGGVPGGHRL